MKQRQSSPWTPSCQTLGRSKICISHSLIISECTTDNFSSKDVVESEATLFKLLTLPSLVPRPLPSYSSLCTASDEKLGEGLEKGRRLPTYQL